MAARGRRWADAPPIHLTIFADASVCGETGAAGWGAWFKGAGLERGETCGGSFAELMRQSNEAELHALAFALCACDERGLLKAGATVMLQSDNTDALAVIRGLTGAHDARHQNGVSVGQRRKALTPAQVNAREGLQAIVQRHGLRIIVRHVRGHQQGDGRNWVNRECDRLAKEGMRARRAELNGEHA